MAGVSGCGSTARKNKMSAQFRAMKRDIKVVEKTPEPETKAQGDGEVLRVLAENGFDAEKAVEEAEKKGIVKEPTTAVAKIVQQKEEAEAADPVDLAKAAADAEEKAKAGDEKGFARAPLCVPLHPALKRIQSSRMKISSIDADPEKYEGQIERSYKDMGGVEIVDYKIVPGDTLAVISLRIFGTSLRWPELWLLNREEVHAFDVLFPGHVIKVPRVIHEKHCEPVGTPVPGPNSDKN